MWFCNTSQTGLLGAFSSHISHGPFASKWKPSQHNDCTSPPSHTNPSLTEALLSLQVSSSDLRDMSHAISENTSSRKAAWCNSPQHTQKTHSRLPTAQPSLTVTDQREVKCPSTEEWNSCFNMQVRGKGVQREWALATWILVIRLIKRARLYGTHTFCLANVQKQGNKQFCF